MIVVPYKSVSPLRQHTYSIQYSLYSSYKDRVVVGYGNLGFSVCKL